MMSETLICRNMRNVVISAPQTASLRLRQNLKLNDIRTRCHVYQINMGRIFLAVQVLRKRCLLQLPYPKCAPYCGWIHSRVVSVAECLRKTLQAQLCWDVQMKVQITSENEIMHVKQYIV